MNIIEVNHIKKYYKNVKALDDISFTLKKGNIYGLIGENGAGKTTLIKILLGAIYPTSGEARINGLLAGSVEANTKIGYVSEGLAIPLDDDPFEYLTAIALLCNIDIKEGTIRIKKLLKQFGLENYLYAKMKTFSSGMKKKIQIISSLLSEPEILILDEPTANLDPNIRYEILKFIKSLSTNSNITVIICSHNLFELEKFVEHIIMIQKGKLLIEGKYSDIFKKMKNNGRFVIGSKDKSKIIHFLKDQPNCNIVNKEPITIESENIQSIKEKLYLFFYENKIQIEEMYDDKKSLYELFSYYTKGEGEKG